MAVNKVIASTSLSIEVQKGVDKAGDAIYGKKTFANVKKDADIQNIFDVAEAIKGVFEGATRDYFVNESSSLANA